MEENQAKEAPDQDAWPVQHAGMIEHILKKHRALMAESGKDTPTLLYLLHSPSKIMRVIDLPSLGSKDTVVAKVRKIARSIRADLALFVHEAWSLSEEDAPRYREIYARYGGLADYPGRIEVLSASLELKGDDGAWIGLAPIERAGGAKRCGPMTVRKGDATGGRLTGWLG